MAAGHVDLGIVGDLVRAAPALALSLDLHVGLSVRRAPVGIVPLFSACCLRLCSCANVRVQTEVRFGADSLEPLVRLVHLGHSIGLYFLIQPVA